MVFTGGWRVLAGALILSAGLVAPATAAADPVACRSWDQVELPVPPAVQFGWMAAAAGDFAVGNGSFWQTDGSTVLVWKGGQRFEQLSFFRSRVWARDVNSSGVVLLTTPLATGASRWQAGAYQALQGFPGEYEVEAVDMNERGDAIGESNGKPVVWPAGSSVPQQVPGTDASWRAVGIADDGSVIASTASGTYWIGASGPVLLGATAQVQEVRGTHAVGTVDVGASEAKVVRWNASGESSEAYTWAESALAVNSSGHLLGKSAWGSSAVWTDAGTYVEANNQSDAYFVSLTDEGDIYGTRGNDPQFRTPIQLDCAGGVR